jgi:polyhydroxyalkanoate synthesis regulator protein
MRNTTKTFDQILNIKIKDILDLIEDVNEQITILESEKSEINDFLIIQFKHQKIDFLKELCSILIGSNLANSKQIDAILDTINNLNSSKEKSIKLGKPLNKQMHRLDLIIKDEQSHLKKAV